jgi:hypothetical protein
MVNRSFTTRSCTPDLLDQEQQGAYTKMFSKSEKCFEPLLYQQNESHDLTKKALELPSSTATPQPSTFNIHMLCQSMPRALNLVFGERPPWVLSWRDAHHAP